jgi:hypothetical protein
MQQPPLSPRIYSWYPRATGLPKGISHEKSNDPIRNGTHALPACSTASQPTAPLHFPLKQATVRFNLIEFTKLHFKIIQINTLNKISEHNRILGKTKLRLTNHLIRKYNMKIRGVSQDTYFYMKKEENVYK